MADRLLRRREVLELTGLSRTTLWNMEREGRFPRRRQVGKSAVAWSEREVVRWMDGLPLAQDGVNRPDSGSSSTHVAGRGPSRCVLGHGDRRRG